MSNSMSHYVQFHVPLFKVYYEFRTHFIRNDSARNVEKDFPIP